MTQNRKLLETLLKRGHPKACCYCNKRLDASIRYQDPAQMTLEHLCPTTCFNKKPNNHLANLSIACHKCNHNKPSVCSKDCVLNSHVYIKFNGKRYRTKRSSALKVPESEQYIYFS
jgi:5-methylcytosine-specific restriction endonuclease McrA